MCLLGLSGMFFESCGIGASPLDNTPMEMMSMSNDAEGMVAKTKRHYHLGGQPCDLPHEASGSYLPPASHYRPPAYQKPLIIPSYHQMHKVESIAYQKPMIPKIVYQTIQRPAVHHVPQHVQPIVKPQVQYIQQQSYAPMFQEQHVSYVKPMAPVYHDNVQKLFTNYVKPVQHIQPLQLYHSGKKIPCETHPVLPTIQSFVHKQIVKPVMEMAQHYPKQFFQQVSYYPKPLSQPKPISLPPVHLNQYNYQTTKVVYPKPDTVHLQQQSILKVAPQVGCEKLHQPMFQYAPQYQHPVVHQPMVHYVPQVQKPAIVQQPLYHIAPKIHQPIAQSVVPHYVHQPVVYGNGVHSVSTVAPPVHYDQGHYQSPIVSLNKPCHK